MKTIYTTILLFCATLSFAQNTVSYQYDNEGRIIHSDDGTKVQVYQYDNLGNRTSYTINSNATSTIDLTVNSISIPNTTVAQGQTYTLSCTAQNLGSTTVGTTILKGYLSPTATGTQTLLTTYNVPSINANSSENLSFNISIPSTANLGSQYLVFFIDANTSITETDETNNKDNIAVTVTVPNLAELNVQNASLSANNVQAGNSIDLTATVHNEGTVTANNFTVKSYLSNNATLEPNDILLSNTTENIASLTVNNSVAYSKTALIPSNTIAGNYYVLFVVDEGDTVAETNETNNTVVVNITVTNDENLLPPVSSFIADNQIVPMQSTIQFTDQSTHNPTSWLWYFPGGIPSSSTLQNPLVVYNSSGVYDVTLITANLNGQNQNNQNNYITVEVDIIDPIAICQNITIQLDDTGNAYLNVTDINNESTDNIGISSMSIDTNSFSCIDLGENIINLDVYDASGNSSTCSATVMVIDDVSPIPNVANLVDLTAQCSVTSLTTPSATDNCSGDVIVTNDVILPITTNTTITWFYTDASNNTSTQTQNVIINDTIEPVAVAQNITIDLNGNTSISIMPSQIDNGSTDNCNVQSISLDIDTFTSVGVYAVVLSVTDFNSNTTSANAEVTVIDTTASISDNLLSNIVIYPNPTNAIINVELVNEFIKSVVFYSELGKKVKESNNNKIDISVLSSGTYLIKVTTITGKEVIKKIIKK